MSKRNENDTRGLTKGAQTHAQGQHGDKTRQRIKEQLNANGAQDDSRSGRDEGDPNGPSRDHGDAARDAAQVHEREFHGGASSGRHRLFEHRTQHDEADLNSDKNRLEKDIDRHGHDAGEFQVPGGAQ
jgi:hypothetical protein